MTENSLISLYCIVDDFIQRFIETSTGKKNEALYYGNRGPKWRMPIADVVTLNLVRMFDRIADVKTFLKIEQLNKVSTLEVVQFVREKRIRQSASLKLCKLDVYFQPRYLSG